MEKTPIAEAIEKLNSLKKQAVHPDYEYGLIVATRILTELLPKEREVIEKVWEDARAFELGVNAFKNFDDYYKTTYTQEL